MKSLEANRTNEQENNMTTKKIDNSGRTKTAYILVQHSGYGYAEDPSFQRAVQHQLILGEKKIEEMRESGVPIYDTYSAASSAEEAVNYPPSVKGLVPRCNPAGFSRKKIDGLRIYTLTPEQANASNCSQPTNENRRTTMKERITHDTSPDYLNDARAAHLQPRSIKLTILTNKRRAFVNALGVADKDGKLPIEREQAERKLLAVALIADACGARSWLEYSLDYGPSSEPSLPVVPTVEAHDTKRRLTDGSNHDVNTLAAIFEEEEQARLRESAIEIVPGMTVREVTDEEMQASAPVPDPILAEMSAMQAKVKKPRKKKESNSRVARWGRAVESLQNALSDLESAKSDFESALEEIKSIREEFESWRDNLDGKFEGSALVEKLEAVCEIDLDSCEIDLGDIENLIGECESADLPLGFGRD